MKKWIAPVFVLLCVLSLTGCNTESMRYITKNKPSVTGIVEEVYSNYIILYSDSADGYPYGSEWQISLHTENEDSDTDLAVGDEIVVYYGGSVMESSPLQVETVYAITLITPADGTENDKS